AGCSAMRLPALPFAVKTTRGVAVEIALARAPRRIDERSAFDRPIAFRLDFENAGAGPIGDEQPGACHWLSPLFNYFRHGQELGSSDSHIILRSTLLRRTSGARSRTCETMARSRPIRRDAMTSAPCATRAPDAASESC